MAEPADSLNSLSRRSFLKGSAWMALALLSRNARAHDESEDRSIGNAPVIVIGAGMAGIAAASYLKSRKAKVTIFEGRNRVGGRIWTDHSLGAALDMGASWIHGVKGNPISVLAKKFKVKTLPTNYDNFSLYDSAGKNYSAAEVATIESKYDSLFKSLTAVQKDLDSDISVAAGFSQVLKDQSLTPAELNQQTWDESSTLCGDFGADLSELSLLQLNEDGAFKGNDAVFPGGYDQIIQGLSQGLDIQLNQIVQKIALGSSGVTVTTNQGTFTAKAVIVTLPLGVLKAGSVTFDPVLPADKLQAIQNLGMGLLNKLALKFPSVFWPAQREFLEYISPNANEFPEMLCMNAYTQDPILWAANTSSFARNFEAKSDADSVAAMMDVLRKMFGSSIPDPTGAAITRWASDPFSLGSYSFMKVGATFDDYRSLAAPVEDQLFFAGEATNDKYPDTVHGAYLSGLREAKNVLRAISH